MKPALDAVQPRRWSNAPRQAIHPVTPSQEAIYNARGDRNLESQHCSPLVANKRTRGVIVLSHGFEPLTSLTVQQMGQDVAVANVREAVVPEAEPGKTI